MKIGKMILGVAGATTVICSAFAFKAQKKHGGTKLFTKSNLVDCNPVNVWTAVNGTPPGALKYYTKAGCPKTWDGEVTFAD